jgi:hypothetical protein
MWKRLMVGIGAGILAAVIAGAALWQRRLASRIPIDTAYQAVLLDNGQVYYARVDRMDNEVFVLSDVYYVEHQVNAETKQVNNILIRRGNEWHAPNRTVINFRHIVMIEPVGAGSKVAELIAALRNQKP